MIEMSGAVTGLVTSEGHRDEIEIRRGFKEDIWDPAFPPPAPICQRRRRYGVPERLAPEGDYRHHETGEDNADAHLKRTVVHHQVVLPVTKGRLDLGPWEQVFYAEFDGRRKKRVVVKVMGE